MVQSENLKIRLKDGALYEAQKAFGPSRDALSRRMGVSTVTAYRVQKGDVDPSPKFIAALMKLTGQPFENLFIIVEDDAA